MPVIRVATTCVAAVAGLALLSGCNASNSAGGLVPQLSSRRVPPPATGSYASPDTYYQGKTQVANPAAGPVRLASADEGASASGGAASALSSPSASSGDRGGAASEDASAVRPASYATASTAPATGAPAPRIPASALPSTDPGEQTGTTPLRLRLRGMEPLDLAPPTEPSSSPGVSTAQWREQTDVGKGTPDEGLRTATADEDLSWREPAR